MTKAQKTFEEVVKKLEKKYQLTDGSLVRYYHDDCSVSVDGELHSILNHTSEFLGEAFNDIYYALQDIGYYLENQNGCDFKFYKC